MNDHVFLIIKLLFPLWFTNVLYVLWHFVRYKYGFWDYPIDFNVNFIDGRRLIGSAKTVVGLFITVMCILIYGIIISDYKVSSVLISSNYIGAAVSGFLKRRFKIIRGNALPLIDQLDYLIMAFVLLNFFNISYFNRIAVFAFPINYLLHKISVVCAYKLGFRAKPY
ncbi:CDP-archaeol synthase [Candidatus Woesebacteria bacterium]|nr:CDP-archaeol synthase [Candidatus Woesebacteria bacterium]